MVKMKHNKTNATNLAATLTAAIIMIFALLLAPATAEAQIVCAKNAQTFINSYYATGTGDVILYITNDCSITDSTITENIYIPANANGATLTIRSFDPQNPAVLMRGVSGDLITVNSGAKLILKDIILDGNKNNYPDNTSPLVYVNGGVFTMDDGAGLMNNIDGGVFVSNGTFTMNGGEITGNTASGGGGVFVGNGTFTMNGGEITGNTASGGGGVQVSNSTFTMNGGKISDNTASGGGGVFMSRSSFTMSGGEISGNTVHWEDSGGGVSVRGGAFTMTGGKISGNTSDMNYGGGVYVGTRYESAEITLGGAAVIIDNTPDNVYLGTGSYITLSTAIPPTYGMNVGVWMENGHGFFVKSGASAVVAGYFHADKPGREVTYENGMLRIPGDNVIYDSIADYSLSPDDMIIEVSGNLTLTDAVIVLVNEYGKTLTIRSADPQNPAILKRGVSGNLFTVNDGAKLIFENIIIDGDKDAYPDNFGSLVINSGEFTMKDGAVLRNNRASRDWTTSYCGGVTTYGSSIFTMLGGKITGNTGSDGGGICNFGTFTMTGGEITDNTGSSGGVYNSGYGRFTMLSGKISGNTATYYGGGGVYVINGIGYGGGDRFITLGGAAIISGNTPDNVYLKTGSFITFSTTVPPTSSMNVGVRMENGYGIFVESGASTEIAAYFYADEPGKEIKHENGRLRIPGGNVLYDFIADYAVSPDDMVVEIGGNLTLTEAVNIPINNNGKTLTIRSFDPQNPAVIKRGVSGNLFTVNNGVKLIFENIIIDGDKDNPALSDNSGSLVYVSSYGEFTMKGGAVLRNNHAYYGGGVHVYSMATYARGIFTMLGGEITGNTATYGGGVFIQNNGSAYYQNGIIIYAAVTMTGGEITGNTASYGGGVYVENGIFTLGGTVAISNNTPDNVYLLDDLYINLDAPASGMNVGIRTATPSGVIVESGAYASHAQYFFADESGKTVVFSSPDQLVIITVPTYAVTVSSAGTGATGGGNYAAGATVSINAGTPPAGQQFKNWTSSPGVTFANANNANTTFTMPASAVTVTANFEIPVVPTYAVTISSAGSGATGGGNYVAGATVSISAGTAPTGQRFNNWTASPAVTFANTNSANTTFIMPSNAVTVTANFVTTTPPVTYYAVTVSSAGTGATGGGSYAAGANVSISAGTVPSGMKFKNWTSSPGVTFANASSPNTTFTMPSNAVTVTANFEPDVQPQESILITGMRPEFQIGLARYDYIWVYAPSYTGIGDVGFAVAGGDGPFMLWIGLPDFPALTLGNIYPGATIDVSGYFYDVAVPEGVSHAGISSFEDAVYGDYSEGDVITLLKTGDEWVLVFDREGVYYEKTFVPDGSNPFPGEKPGVEPVVTVPSAAVEKLSGGKERLTISLTETLSDGSTVAGTVAVTINENTAGYYTVGPYLIYVDALGSGSIRRCYIVNRD